MTQQTLENTTKITNPERIARILSKMCEGRMQVIIRTKESSKLGIRANFLSLSKEGLLFDRISVFGLEKIPLGLPVKIEVLGMPTMVMFFVEARQKDSDKLVCSVPSMLVSVERRQNSRFKVIPSSMAYMSFSMWQPEDQDLGAPPFFEAYRTLASWIPMVDISAGGVCLSSHFPSFLSALESVSLDAEAKLHLPMQNPLPVQAAIRWKRRIRNRFADNDSERYQLDFRLGIEFVGLSDEHKLRIRNYLRQLSVAEAI